jgi:hypothetical protein
MKFTLEFELGADELRRVSQVYSAVTSALVHLRHEHTAAEPCGGAVRDNYGKPIGHWAIASPLS